MAGMEAPAPATKAAVVAAVVMVQKVGMLLLPAAEVAVGDLPEKMLMVSTAAAVVATVPVTTAAAVPERLPGNQASL